MPKPAYIDRYDYGKCIAYMEPPGFIIGADRYIPVVEVEERHAYIRQVCDLVEEALNILRDIRCLDQAAELDRERSRQ